jgi:simple sugar transport system permease protein
MVVTDNLFFAVVGSMLSGLIISLIFGLLTQSLLTNHVATGLALTIFGIGMSAMIGKNFVGIPGKEFPLLFINLKESIPFLGPIFFGHSIILYFAFGLPFLTNYFLKKTKTGLIIRAVGDSPTSASNQGINVKLVRYSCILYGGAMCGLAGAYLSLIYTPQWIENMTGGRGWIALALVVFATWSPIKVLIGALIFGGITILQLHMQAVGLRIPVQLLSALPYIMTIIVLVVISRDSRKIRLSTPSSLGKSFHKDN